MIREIIKPGKSRITINISPHMINQKLELILFPIIQDTDMPLRKKNINS